MVYTFKRTDQNTKVIGKTIFKTATEKKLGLTHQIMKEDTTLVRNTEWDVIAGMMAANTEEIGMKIKFKD